MHELAVSLGLPEIEEETRFYLYRDVAALAPVFEAATGSNSRVSRESWYQGDGRVAEQFRGNIFLTTSGFTTDSLRNIAAHELNHAHAKAISGFDNSGPTSEVQTHGPVWLYEGIAYLTADLALDRGGSYSYSDIRSSSLPYNRGSDFPQLRFLDTRDQTWSVRAGDWYGKWAAELLASLAGESALYRYFTLLQPGTTWKEAFQGAFGMTVEEFYELFEEHRAAGFPEVHIASLAGRPTPTATPAPTPTRTPTPTPISKELRDVDGYIVWKIGGEVSPAAEAEARSTVLAVHDFAVSNGLRRVDDPITIFLYHNLDSLASEFEAPTGREYENWFSPSFKEGETGTLSSKDFVAINTSASGYHERSPDDRARSLAENLFRVYRLALTGIWEGAPRDAVHREGPRWLSEGYAEYFTYQAIGPLGSESCDLTRSSNIVPISWGPADTSLRDMETDEGFWSQPASRHYGFLAAELLAEQAGIESIFAYYASLRGGIAWERAFETAFSITVDEFYQLFEDHRAAGFPEPGTPKPVNEPAPTPGPLSDLLGDPNLPSYIKWDIAASVDQFEVEQAILGVRLAYKLGESLGIPDPTGQIILFIDNDVERLACFYSKVTGWSLENSRRHWGKDSGGAVAGSGWIMVLASPPGKQYWERPT